MPTALRCVIFDFDGPIFDGRGASRKALTATFDRYLASTGRPTVAVDTLPLYGPAGLIALAYAEFPDAAAQLPAIRDSYTRELQGCERQTKVDDGVRALLRDLETRDIKCAILSSRPTIELVDLITFLGLRDAFSEVWGGDMASGSKPSPAAITALATKLGVAPAETVFIGDSDRDFDATKDTGITYYHAAWTGEPASRAYTGCRALLRSVADMKEILRDNPPQQLGSHRNVPSSLVEAIRADRLTFYAGAGVSVRSGIGDWNTHYLPILRQLQVGLFADRFSYSLPQLLQLAASDGPRSEQIYKSFKQSFAVRAQHRPNPYHYAMIRSGASRIWTTNYDQLFESAIAAGGFPHRVINNDPELLDNFEHDRLIIKMNGDFERSKYQSDLEWDIVFLEQQFDLAELRRREIWRSFEDDYRSSSIVFVGTSFNDPALRRLLSIAAKAVPRTRFWHHLLVKAADHPADRIIEQMYRENLKRVRIETHLFDDYGEIERWVQQVAMIANRPIVGFSGTGKQDNSAGLLENGTITTNVIADLCERLGRGLAARDFRVTSGHGPGVGVPVVEAAFEQNPNAARFYLRKRGSSKFSRTAPALVVPGEDFAAMRDRFIGELDLLVAIGGDSPGPEESGTEAEIGMALARSIPVVILTQGGGNAARRKPAMMSNLSQSYADPKLAALVGKLNEDLDAVAPEALPGYVSSTLIDRIEDLIAATMGTSEQRAADDGNVAAQRRW